MIDTDKYEGHTPAPWRIECGDMEQYGETDTVLSGIDVVALDVMRQDARLIADAPLLLAEVKRLREQVKDLEYEVEHWQGELQSRMHPIDYDALVNGGEEE